MRLKDFLDRVDEKVSSKEINTALENSNILVGGEFEWIPYELKEKIVNGTNTEYEDALDDWRQWETEYEKYLEEMKELMDLEDDIEKRMFELQDKFASLGIDMDDPHIPKYKKDEIEAERDELALQIEQLKNEKDEITNKMNDLESPGIGDDYLDYVPTFNTYFSERYPEPEEPDNVGDDEVEWLNVARPVLEKLLKNAPFSDYEISGYDEVSQKPGSTTWAIEYDNSVTPYGGVEMASPPMELPEFIDICKKMFNFIDRNGYTSDKCGFHIHMSIKGESNLKQNVDPVKLMLFTDEEYIFKSFQSRENNEYVKSVKKSLMRGEINKGALKELFDYKKLNLRLAENHHNSIRFLDEQNDPSRVEFRYIGGQGYHTKFTKIKTIIAQYAHNLSMAADPEYKKKKYIRKLVRIINKVEWKRFYVKKILLETIIKLIEKDSLPVKSKNKAYRVSKKLLKKYEKLTKNTDYKSDITGLMIEITKDELAEEVLKEIGETMDVEWHNFFRKVLAISRRKIK